jgi:hypothetical protein
LNVCPAQHCRGELQALGYDVIEIGEGERILPAAITQQFTLGLVGKCRERSLSVEVQQGS